MKAILAALTALHVGCAGPTNDAAPAPKPAPPAPAAVMPPAAPGTQADDEPPATPALLQESEAAASQRDAARPACTNRVAIFDGSLDVGAADYASPDGAMIAGLDDTVSKAPRLDFTLDYPFDKPFTGSVAGAITLRRIIDEVRGGFRHMYAGTSQRAVPGMYNKDVRGTYGRAFHVIGDLVIEHIDLCGDRWLELTIGS
ncbi:MAG: hypothetical protein K8W52_41720 [Deltaproteobacteria bacterium]|nr:hypothetical protein [Deltaproteobacteria bacterium]